MNINRLFVLVLLISSIAACTKIRETEIGTGLIPSVDGVITKDTNITIYAKNWSSVDTVRPSLADDHALGYITDALFGTTQAAINVQMQPTSFPFTFGASADSLTLDSVVLALQVRGIWGDSNQNLSLHVRELDNSQTFLRDTSYVIYNNTSFFTASNELTYNGGGAQIDPKTLNDSFRVFQDSGVNMLRVRLSDDFGNRLLRTYDSSREYKSDSSFREAFKGFQISADAVGNALLRIGLANTSNSAAEANTKLAIYFKRKRSTGTDTSLVNYFTVNANRSVSFNQGSAHSNYIARNRSGSQAGGYYPTPTSDSNDNFIYIQSSPGTKATLTIDSAALKNLPNWIIHRAEIVMEQAPEASTSVLDNFTAPYLFLLAKDKDSIQPTSFFNIPGFDSLSTATTDAVFSSNSLANYTTFGGVPRRKNDTQGQYINYYNFEISRYIQGIVTKKNMPFTFVLYTPYKETFRLVRGSDSYGRGYVAATPPNNAGIGRVRLYGGGNSAADVHRMKLHIVYSVPH